MTNLKLVKKIIIFPGKQTSRRRMFLSNIDLSLVTHHESVSFFDPPTISFSEICEKLYRALECLLVPYDFFAGRLVPDLKDGCHLEIDCNGGGIVVAAATSESKLNQLGNLMRPKLEFKQFVEFLHEENEESMEIKDMPLLFIQMTRLGCGGIALASRYNHCVLDGVAVREFETNLAALTRDEHLVITPNPDRTIFKARNPPVITHHHHEYSTRPINTDDSTSEQSSLHVRTHLVHLSPHHIAAIKKAALGTGRLKNPTTFQVVAARIWKARSVATGMEDERVSTMLFPVDCRQRVTPPAPVGFAGNALIPGFARARVRELKEEDDCVLVKKVQEGVERLDDEYVRSSIDWLEVNKGVPRRESSFSLVAWWRLGLEEDEFAWGKIKCATPFLKPGLVYLLPGPKDEGGLNVCLELPDDQIEEFHRLMMEN